MHGVHKLAKVKLGVLPLDVCSIHHLPFECYKETASQSGGELDSVQYACV